ncbi:FeoA family protein [Phormidesmis sp. 146-35]
MTDEPDLSELPVWREFTFLSGGCEAEVDLAVQAGLTAVKQIDHSSPLILLAQTNAGDRVRIIKLHCLNALAELTNAGMIVGAEVQILSRTVSGSVVVRCYGRSIGVGSAIAQSILATRLEPSI